MYSPEELFKILSRTPYLVVVKEYEKIVLWGVERPVFSFELNYPRSFYYNAIQEEVILKHNWTISDFATEYFRNV